MNAERSARLPADADRRLLVQGACTVLLAASLPSLLVGGCAATAAADPAVAQTTAGPVRGTVAGGAVAFKGVPYADAAAGANRFMPPRPPRPWTAVRDATAYGAKPPGLGYPPILMSEEGVDLDKNPPGEDSLALNVWTPRVGAGGRRPVMVWLHGGGYNSGSGGSVRYDGTRLAARQDVVVVTVNHRLGALGFLHLAGLGDARFAQSANLGMQDIVRSLEWVRDNIAGFGGDPANVTVFGESGGGGKVSTLMAMPSARGLFHRAIAQSGVALKLMPAEAGTQMARGVLDKLGVGAGELDKLMALPFDRIAAATPPNIAPVVDGTVVPRNPFDPDAPAVSAQVPLLMGSNLSEMTFFNETPLDPIDEARLVSGLATYTRQSPANVQTLVALYRSHRPGTENHLLYQAIASDWWMTSAVQQQAERKAAQGAAPVWVYQFGMRQGARGGKLGAPHTAEIAYVFDNLALSSALVGTPTAAHQALADRMSASWAAFARNGDPNGAGLPRWAPYDSTSRTVMLLDENPRAAPAWLADEQRAINAMKPG